MIMNNKMNIQNVDLYYGKFQALKNISLDIPENEITALILSLIHIPSPRDI